MARGDDATASSEGWRARKDSNPRPSDPRSDALSTELRARTRGCPSAEGRPADRRERTAASVTASSRSRASSCRMRTMRHPVTPTGRPSSTEPIVSAIVPLYETERYIARCLDSLLAQDLASPDLEIIVIDDGSTDGGGTVAERYAAAHSNISVSRQPNQGLSATRNLGLELARGRYVAFVDSDDHLAPHALGELVALAQRERLDAVAFEYARPWLDEEIPDPPTIVPAEVRVSSGMAHFAEHPYLTPAWAYVWR